MHYSAHLFVVCFILLVVCVAIIWQDDVIKWKTFRVTGPLCGEFIGHRWIPRTKASDAELRCFLWYAPEQTFAQTRRWRFETPSHSLLCHCNETRRGLDTYLHSAGVLFDEMPWCHTHRKRHWKKHTRVLDWTKHDAMHTETDPERISHDYKLDKTGCRTHWNRHWKKLTWLLDWTKHDAIHIKTENERNWHDY